MSDMEIIRIHSKTGILELPYSLELEQFLWRKGNDWSKRGFSMRDPTYPVWNMKFTWLGVDYELRDIKKYEITEVSDVCMDV